MLESKVLGKTVNNPVCIASGPWTRGKEKISKALDTGVGAVFTETIVLEPCLELSPRYAYNSASGGLQNIRMYSSMNLDTWTLELEELMKNNKYDHNGLVIASIMAQSTSELIYMTNKVEKTGIDGIEIGISCPFGEDKLSFFVTDEKIYKFAKAVVDNTNLPVSVKLSASMLNIPDIAAALTEAGISGISAIDTVKCLLGVDIETRKSFLPTFGGYSGSPIKPLALASVAGISQSTALPVTGIGGITGYINILEHIMVGASSAAFASSILIKGYEHVKKSIGEFNEWCKTHNVTEISSIKGSSIKFIQGYDEIVPEPKKARLDKPCDNILCPAPCINCCLDDAIIRNDEMHVIIDRNQCTGCGLCTYSCPENLIKLTW